LGSLVYISVIIVFIASWYLFNETQKVVQYIGCLITIIAMVAISLSNHVDSAYIDNQSPETINYQVQKGDLNLEYFYISIALFLTKGVVASMFTLSVKYASYYYRLPEYEFMLLSRSLGCGFAAISALFIVSDFSLLTPTNIFKLNYLVVLTGVLQYLGWICKCQGIRKGKVQLTQLIICSYPFVQILCETVFLHKYPTALQTILIIVIFVGTGMIILNETKKETLL